MINEVHFRNFKSLRDASLKLERLTVLVGPNASGKTSVLEGLSYLVDAKNANNAEEFLQTIPSPRLLLSSGQPGTMQLTCRSGHLWTQLGVDLPERAWPTQQEFSAEPFRSEHGIVMKEGQDQAKFEIGWGRTCRTKDIGLGPAAFLRLDAERLKTPSYSEQPVPTMQPNGEGLASVLSYMASNQPEGYEAVQDAFRKVIPIVRGMRFPRARVTRLESEFITIDEKPFKHQSEREYWGDSIEFDMKGASGIPVEMVSEGTLLVLGLLTVLIGPNQPRLVLLDDIDRGLHPKAQEDLVDLLRKLLDQYSEMQIVATSHSPYLLDHLRPEEVRLTTLKDDGSAVCGRLDDHREFKKWKETMTPGEFWSVVGENWLVENSAKEPG